MKFNLSAQIFLLTFGLIITLLTLLSSLHQRNSSSALLNAQKEYAWQLIGKNDEYMDLNIKNVESFFLSIARDKRLQSNDYEQMEGWMNENLIYFIPHAKNLHLLKDDKVVVSTSSVSWMLDRDDSFRSELEQVREPEALSFTQPYFSSVSGNTVTAVMRIPGADGTAHILALDLELSTLYESLLLANQASPLQGQLLLLDRDSRPLYGVQPYTQYNVFDRRYELTVFQPAVFGGNWSTVEWKDAERDLLLLRSRNNLLGWQVVWAMDRKELLVPLQRNISYSWFLVMLSFVLSLIVAWAISLFISRPINQIAGSMDRVGAGQWDTAIPVTRRDELGRLANHFNRMTNTIRELIADLQRTEKAKKESDFRALQTQIRPHFLFNTFNSISIAAKEHQPDKVDLLITSLTETLHYSLERSPAPVTLDEELRAVQSYIQLMQLRYDNRFSVLTDIDESTAGFVIPKFTLQPLIENCIFHGLIPKEGVGTLFVGSTRYRDTWDIIIEDTGVGIASDTLGALLDKLNGNAMESGIPEFEHIGLSNVHYRLKLMFGERYQLEMTSSKQSGTRIVLSLPIAFE